MASSAKELPRPDLSIHPVGKSEADVVGPMQLALLEHFGLNSDTALMEIGCGVGRLTYHLAQVIDPPGRYAGFDLSAKAIAWLEENYGEQLKHFRFDAIDVFNARYHPRGTVQPHDVRFPYDDNSFDMACAFSVFTHMQPREIVTYLAETHRVLKPRGVAVATFFSIEPADTSPTYGDKPFHKLRLRRGTWTLDRKTPEVGIGFSSARIDEMVSAAGLRVLTKLRGYWHGTKRSEAPYCHAHQDVYALTREA